MVYFFCFNNFLAGIIFLPLYQRPLHDSDTILTGCLSIAKYVQLVIINVIDGILQLIYSISGSVVIKQEHINFFAR